VDGDSELGRQAAAGDAAAFAVLVRRHEGKVRRFLSRLAPGGEADDIAQDAFVAAWRARGDFRGGSYGAWLMRIAWTHFLSHRRSHSRRTARDHAAWEAAEHAPASSPDLRLDVAQALAGLDERERAAAMLCFAEGWSHGEAAEIMQLPLGTLKSIVARARTRLLAVLETEHD
jgi:RNA polymerase sigma-70 factor (ECF subfamily)